MGGGDHLFLLSDFFYMDITIVKANPYFLWIDEKFSQILRKKYIASLNPSFDNGFENVLM